MFSVFSGAPAINVRWVSLDRLSEQTTSRNCSFRHSPIYLILLIFFGPLVVDRDSSCKNKEHKDYLFGPGDCQVGSGSSMQRGGVRKVCSLSRTFVFLGFRGREVGMFQKISWDVPEAWGCSKTLV